MSYENAGPTELIDFGNQSIRAPDLDAVIDHEIPASFVDETPIFLDIALQTCNFIAPDVKPVHMHTVDHFFGWPLR